MKHKAWKLLAALLALALALTAAPFAGAKEFFAGTYSEEYHDGGYDAGYDPNYDCNAIDDQEIRYVIDDNFTFTEQSDNYLPDKYVPSGWDVRTIGGQLMGPYYHTNWQMIDTSEQFPVQANRKFERLDHGVVTLEYLFTLVDQMDGAAWRVYQDNTVAVGVVVEGNKLYLEQNGEKVYLADFTLGTMYGVKLMMDIDNDVVKEVYFTGKRVAENVPFVNAVPYINNFDVTTTDAGTGTLALHGVYMYRGYAINERFTMTTGVNVPDDFVKTSAGGSVVMNTSEANIKPDIYNLELSGGAQVTKSFDPQSGKLVMEWSMIQPEKGDGARVDFLSGGSSAFAIVTEQGQFCYTDPSGAVVPFYDYMKNIWYRFKLTADLENGTMDIDLNYIPRVQGIALKSDVKSWDALQLSTSGVTTKFDTIYLKQFVPEPDDYCPEPEPAINPNYQLGMQFCPMWKNGSHVGWDGVNSDKDRLPYLGYYDEGDPEVADWLIKQLVEHGFSFQRVVWCTFPNETEPIDTAFMGGHYLNGLKQAKYSNMMDYMIMWENYAMGGTAERLVNVVGPYWIEHFFKDERYLRIDGRPVVAFLDAPIYLTYNDNDMERAKKGLADFRQLCIDAGVGDPIIAVGGGMVNDVENIKLIKELGFDVISPYGTAVGSYYEQDKLAFSQKENCEGIIDFMPTFSSGLYGMSSGTSGYVPNDMIESFLTNYRDEYVPAAGDSPYANMAIFDTYDEYVEGHYYSVMGRTGFALFDIVRDVFYGESEHEDIVPTMKQKNRFNNLYPYGRNIPPFKEDDARSDVDINSLEVKKGWYFDTPGDTEGWESWADNLNLTVADGCLTATVNGPDPMVVSTEEVDISDVVYLKMRVKIDGTLSMGQVFFATNESPGASEGKSDFMNFYTNDFEEKTFYLAANKEWTGTLNTLRIDPVNAANGQTWYIDSIELLYDPSIAESFVPEEDKPGLKLCIDGVYKKLKNECVYVEDKAYFPLREIAEEMGAQKIDYDGKKGLVNIIYGDIWTQFDPAEGMFSVGGSPMGDAENFLLQDGSTYVDERVLALVFGLNADWNGTDVLTINKSEQQPGGTVSQKREALYAAEFEYDGDVEGWTSWQVGSLKAANGLLSGTMLGEEAIGDAVLWTADNLAVPAEQIKNISISYQNKSDATKGKIYFSTEADPTENEEKAFTFDINPNDTGITTYNIDPSTVTNWGGVIKKLRFDPCSGENTGGFDIDFFRLEGELLPDDGTGSVSSKTVTDSRVSWEFNVNGAPDGWELSKSLGNVALDGGILYSTIVGTTPTLTTMGNLNLPAEQVSKIRIRLKNNTTATEAKLYFRTDENDCWCDEQMFTFPVNARDGAFDIYEIDTSGCPAWTGVIDGLQLWPTDGKGMIEIDYIRLEA